MMPASVHNPRFRRRVARLWDADPEGLNSGEPSYDVDGPGLFPTPKSHLKVLDLFLITQHRRTS